MAFLVRQWELANGRTGASVRDHNDLLANDDEWLVSRFRLPPSRAPGSLRGDDTSASDLFFFFFSSATVRPTALTAWTLLAPTPTSVATLYSICEPCAVATKKDTLLSGHLLHHLLHLMVCEVCLIFLCFVHCVGLTMQPHVGHINTQR